jgi:hypothetical protein
MLVAQRDKSPDRNPDTVDLGEILTRIRRKEDCHSHQYIATYATEEVTDQYETMCTRASACIEAYACSVSDSSEFVHQERKPRQNSAPQTLPI